MKICTGCKQSKPLDQFNKNSSRRDKLHYRCRECCNLSTRLSENKNRDKVNLTNSEWKKRNPEKRKRDNRKWRLENYYGLTEDQYKKMCDDQDNRCAICKRHQSELKVALAVDHNHDTGVVRQLLCRRCNSALGYIKEDINIALNLVEYIRKHDANLIL